MVLLDHFVWAKTGRLGVEVFFVLSGFLMARILFEQRVPLPLFYQRRLARTLPVFYLYLLTMVLFGLVLLPTINWTNVLAAAVFLRGYVGEHIWADPLALGHTWSLNVEEHAYLLLSLVIVVAGHRSERVSRWIVTALTVVPLLFDAYYKYFPSIGDTPPVLRTECAIFPLLASASLFLWIKARRIRISRAWFVVLFLAMLILAIVDVVGVPRGGLFIRNLLLPLAMAAVVNFLDCAPVAIKRALSAKWLTWFGVCSYSLYLWHYPFFHLMVEDAWPFGTFAAVLCSFAVAVASFYWFEQPMRAWLRGERGSKSVAIAPASAVATDEAK